MTDKDENSSLLIKSGTNPPNTRRRKRENAKQKPSQDQSKFATKMIKPENRPRPNRARSNASADIVAERQKRVERDNHDCSPSSKDGSKFTGWARPCEECGHVIRNANDENYNVFLGGPYCLA